MPSSALLSFLTFALGFFLACLLSSSARAERVEGPSPGPMVPEP